LSEETKIQNIPVVKVKDNKTGKIGYQVGTNKRIFYSLDQAKFEYNKQYKNLNKPKTETKTQSQKSLDKILAGEGTRMDSSIVYKKGGGDQYEPVSDKKERYSDMTTKLLKDKARLQEETESLQGYGLDDPTSEQKELLKELKDQMKEIDLRLTKYSPNKSVQDSTTTSQADYNNQVQQKQSWFNKFMHGSLEQQKENAWIEKFIQDEKNAFNLLPRDKNWEKERMIRTNQWYKDRAKEAYLIYKQNEDNDPILIR
jgi:small-conductance mechanosensitive channel